MMAMSSSLPEKLNRLFADAEGIIFDFDGLLADSEPYHYRAYNEVFERYGHSLDPDEYWVEWTSKGKGIAGEIERHDLDLDVDPIELRKQKFEVYSRFCESGEIKLFADAVGLVELLAGKRKLAIASGSWVHDIRAILKNANAESYFPTILGKESATKEKPHPEIFLNTAKAINLPPKKCLVLEDALKGLSAANQASIPCIIIRNKLNQDIDFPDADLLVPSLADLVSLLNSSL